MTLVRAAETQGPPPAALMEAMAKASADPARAGALVMTGGLAPMAAATRVRVARGSLTVTDGPFAEAKEVVGGYAVLDLPTKEAAVEAATWLMRLHAEHWPEFEGEVEVRQIFGPGDPGAGC